MIIGSNNTILPDILILPSPIRQEGMIMEYVQAHGRIERRHVMELCGLTSTQAGRLLKKMVNIKNFNDEGHLRDGHIILW